MDLLVYGTHGCVEHVRVLRGWDRGIVAAAVLQPGVETAPADALECFDVAGVVGAVEVTQEQRLAENGVFAPVTA